MIKYAYEGGIKLKVENETRRMQAEPLLSLAESGEIVMLDDEKDLSLL